MDFNEFIDGIAAKFGYDEELVSALKRCIPVMIEGKDPEDIQLLKEALENAEIYTFDKQPTREQVDAIMKEKVNGRNDHVTFLGHDRGEYGTKIAAASYRTQEILDENMNIIDRVGFIYTTKLSKFNKVHESYGTMIDLSSLIHEIGHAWASQKDKYIQREDGTYIIRIGASECECSVDRESHTVTDIEEKYLYIEEAGNTLEEERAICKLLNVDSIKKIPGYSISAYQWKMSDMMRSLDDALDLKALGKWRFQNDKSVIGELNELFKKTNHYEDRSSEKYCDEKKEALLSYKDEKNMHVGAKLRMDKFFTKYDELYFGKKDTPNFMEYFNDILESFYNLGKVSYSFYDEENKCAFQSLVKIVRILKRDAHTPINEMKRILDLEQEKKTIETRDVLMNALNSGADIRDIEEIEKEINGNKDRDVDNKTAEEH